ncbi:YCF48-related protein [Seonamhaeicola maritimus]|uniref:T9SS type A sorting domain-containing protein n=1 Tax=Seonamhaeicola maritimus TaxID=2591822 RepID=A0A5C7GNP3_9FLAO|nr:YCF48-related protein [Seonamhaeicola maritimus]TXG40113.1 T9SS type A sorting domain-containing protein [Seonamhaeicola maritimus]
MKKLITIKKFSIFVFSILCFNTGVFAQWESIPSGTTNNLWDVHFPSTNIGYAVGWNDTVLKTIDGGTTWAVQNTLLSGFRYYGVHFKNELSGFAVGRKEFDNGIVHYTTDGGANWFGKPLGFQDLLWNNIDFAEDNVYGIMVGQEGQIAYSDDGGDTWYKRISPAGTLGHVMDVDFVDEWNAIAVGYSSASVGFIIKTTDGGGSWSSIETNIAGGLYSVSFVDAQNGLAVGSGGRIYKTSDGGNSWSLKYTGTNTLNGVHFYDNEKAITVGNAGDIFVSQDGGANWEFQDSGTTFNLRGVCKNNNATAFATGVSGLIIKDNCAQSGTISFLDNTSPPFKASDLTVESKIYFYYNVEDNANVPPICTVVEEFQSFSGQLVKIGAQYLGNGLLQMWLDFSTDSTPKSLTISIPNSISQNGLSINFENKPPNFQLDLKVREDVKESVNVFGGAGVGLSLIEGGIGVGGASVALSKQSLTGSGGMGLKFTYDLSGAQTINRTFNVSAGVSAEIPAIGSNIPIVNEVLQGEVKLIGSFGQSMKFIDDSDTTKKAKAAYLMESFGLGSIPLSPFAGVYMVALKNVLVDLNPDLNGLYSTYHNSNQYGVGVEGNISVGYNFKFGETEFDFFQAGVNTSLSVSLESLIKENKKSIDIGLATAFDLSALDLKILNDKVDFGKQLNFNFGGKIGLNGTYDSTKGSIDKIGLVYESNESAQVSLLHRSVSRKYEFIIPESVIASNSGVDNLIGVTSDLLTLGESNKTFKAGVDYFTSNLDEIYSQNPLTLGEYSQHNIMQISESNSIGVKDNIGIDLSIVIGSGVGVSLGLEYGYLSESEYLKSEYVVINDTILPTVKNARNLDDLVSLSGEITDLLNGTTLLLDGAFDELISKVEQPIEDGIAFIVDIGDSTVELAGTLVSDGEKWVLRWLDPTYNTIFNKTSGFKSEVRQVYASKVSNAKEGIGLNKLVENSKLYIISNNLNLNLMDIGENPIETFDPVNLSITIDQAKVDELEFTDTEKALAKMYLYDDVNLVWEEVTGDNNVDINIVETQITKAGNYAIGIAYDPATMDNTAPEIQDHYPKEGNVTPPTEEYWATLYEALTGAGIDLAQTIIKIDDVEVAALWDPVNNKILYTPETPLTDGSHTFEVVVKDLNGNTNSIFSNFTVDSTLSTEFISDINTFRVYPNPTQNLLHIKGNISELNSISIYNALGQHVMSVGDNLERINISTLKPALYFVKLRTNEGERIIKIVKE